MCAYNSDFRTPFENALRRKIAEPNTDPKILQFARDIGKYYGDYPGLREQVAAILRSKLREPGISLDFFQVALSTREFDPALYFEAANFIRSNMRGFDTSLDILQLALEVITYDTQVHENGVVTSKEDEITIRLRAEIITIIDSKFTGATTSPRVLALAWDTRNRKLREKVETIVSSLFAGNAQVTDPMLLRLTWCMRISHPALGAKAKSIVECKLAESAGDHNSNHARDQAIFQLAHLMNIIES
jgi:hypothetical protein